MQLLYKIIKIFYYILTTVIGVFFLRWELLFGSFYNQILEYLIPGYLVFCGLMIGYVISRLTDSATDDDQDTPHLVSMKSFVIGIVIGIVLALLYIFLQW